MTNLQQRVIAAVVAVPFLIFCIVFSDWTFYGLVAVIAILTQLEFYKFQYLFLSKKDLSPNPITMYFRR
jgi:CDP-diglyceride synthetase